MPDDNSPKPAISLDDLYGKSEPEKTDPSVLNPEHLVYEETPEITPVPEDVPPSSVTPPPPPAEKTVFRTEENTPPVSLPVKAPAIEFSKPADPGRRLPGHRKNLAGFAVILVLIFAFGMGASVLYRNLVLWLTGENAAPTQIAPAGSDTGEKSSALRNEAGTDFFDQPPDGDSAGDIREGGAGDASQTETIDWSRMTLVRGTSRVTVPGIFYLLPGNIPEPVCDGASCPSMGTYLDGGTRLTLAFYDRKLAADDLSRTIVTDAAGRRFETREATVSGQPALEFTGTFTGTTTGGYRFTAMRGYMVLTPAGQTLEINHFTPAGITADFESDDPTFEKIAASVSFQP